MKNSTEHLRATVKRILTERLIEKYQALSASEKGEVIYITEAEAAIRTGYSRKFFQKRRKANNGPAFSKKGRTIRYKIDDLDKWMDDDEE